MFDRQGHLKIGPEDDVKGLQVKLLVGLSTPPPPRTKGRSLRVGFPQWSSWETFVFMKVGEFASNTHRKKQGRKKERKKTPRRHARQASPTPTRSPLYWPIVSNCQLSIPLAFVGRRKRQQGREAGPGPGWMLQGDMAGRPACPCLTLTRAWRQQCQWVGTRWSQQMEVSLINRRVPNSELSGTSRY